MYTKPTAYIKQHHIRSSIAYERVDFSCTPTKLDPKKPMHTAQVEKLGASEARKP